MSRERWLPLVLVLTVCLSGCDASGKYKAVFADRLKAEQDLLALLKDVHDQASMEKAVPELRKIGWRLERIKKTFEALPALADEDKREIEKEFVTPLQAVKNEQVDEARRINALPGGQEFLNKLKHL
jgi:hypothetical protein